MQWPCHVCVWGGRGGGRGGDGAGGAPSEGTPPAAAAEHQILLAGCSGAGKTTLFRQLGLAFGPGASFTALEKLQAAAEAKSQTELGDAASDLQFHQKSYFR